MYFDELLAWKKFSGVKTVKGNCIELVVKGEIKKKKKSQIYHHYKKRMLKQKIS